jgi:ribosomal protein S18 acetylase RimI-like enzyme
LTNLRPYRNADSPALATLWNRALSGSGVAHPLTVHEFDQHVVGGPLFDAKGMVVAERDGVVVGFVHAGFGPAAVSDPPLHTAAAMGTVAMLVVDPGREEEGLEDSLLAEAERYLRRHGAEVIYAGGQLPLNPFYWGVYGGSEWSGVLDSHTSFHRVLERAGYVPVSTSVLLEVDLSEPERRDPRGVLLRRQTRLEIDEEAQPDSWWEALAIGDAHLTHYRLFSRSDEIELAHASSWDMGCFGRADGRSRVGLTDLEVDPEQRRKGYGRLLVQEVLRSARVQATKIVAVQTRDTNLTALNLYQSSGFVPVGTSTLYRLPAGGGARPV